MGQPVRYYSLADGSEKIRLCKSEKRSLLIMEHTVDEIEIKEIIESDSDMAPRNKLHALQFTVGRSDGLL